MKALAQWEKGGYQMQGDRQRDLEKFRSNRRPQGLQLRRNMSRRASGWGGIVGRCRRVVSGGRILTFVVAPARSAPLRTAPHCAASRRHEERTLLRQYMLSEGNF